jgi:hypothetical protein
MFQDELLFRFNLIAGKNNQQNPSQTYIKPKELIMSVRYIYLIAIILGVSVPSFSQTNILEIKRGAYVCDCDPSRNLGSSTIYQGPYYTGGHKCYARTTTYWSLDSLPKGINITSAIIEFKCKAFYGTLTGQMVFYRFLQTWDAAKVSFVTLPQYTSEDSIIADWPAVGAWLSINATNLVRFWYEHPDSNFGLYGHCANTTSNTGAVEFYGSSYSSAYRPKLTVTYTTTDVKSTGEFVPTDFKLNAFPNPFNPSTNISYTLVQSGRVTLDIIDLQGRIVDRLVNANQSIGGHNVQWNANRFTSSIYLVSLSSGERRTIKKLALIK